MSMVASYVRQHDGEYYVGDTRVTTHTIVTNWKRGASPEEIQAAFPSPPLVAIYCAITYYLEHQAELDAHFRETDEILARRQAAVEAAHPEFVAKSAFRTEIGRW
jgi:uncharacterized protein (DUF433 family)